MLFRSVSLFLPTLVQFGSSSQSNIDASGNGSFGSSAVLLNSVGVYSSFINARNSGNILTLGGREIAGSGSPSVKITAASGLNATDTVVQLGGPSGGQVYIMQSGNVGIGAASPTAQLQVAASSTVRLGVPNTAYTGCIEMYDSVNTSTLEYLYTANGVLTATTTHPSFCQ